MGTRSRGRGRRRGRDCRRDHRIPAAGLRGVPRLRPAGVWIGLLLGISAVYDGSASSAIRGKLRKFAAKKGSSAFVLPVGSGPGLKPDQLTSRCRRWRRGIV